MTAALAAVPATAEQHLSQLSHHIDAAEEIAEAQFFTIANGSPLALRNLLARLARLQQTIEVAASK
jgi:hypothetical protein